jgi:hypothetical protein
MVNFQPVLRLTTTTGAFCVVPMTIQQRALAF